MDIRFSSEAPTAIAADAIAVFAGTAWKEELADLDAALGGKLIDWLDSQSFDGKPSAPQITATFGAIGAANLIVLGVGDRSEATVRKAASRAGRAARSVSARHLAVHDGGGLDTAALVEHVVAGNYVFDRYKMADDQDPSIETLTLTASGDTKAATVRARWQSWARDLVNAPPADLYPETLAGAAVDALGGLEHVRVEVMDFEACRAAGMVGIIAVGQGSARPGCLIKVSYRPPNAKGHIAFVGKGVTFDAGGLSLKPSSAMQTMRCDMGGSAVVLGATGAIAELSTPINVDCFVGAVENMVGGNSFKLGDILEYRNGVTVEIHNTDAEGRLVLADCLIEACKTDATHIIDAATLTGACVVAIGGDFTGVFTDSDEMASSLQSAADASGELVWRLPLHAPYKEMLRGDWSKIKNVGSRAAGATTAALYLQHFVTDDVTWAHLDVAGSSWRDRSDSRWASGATAEMVRTLTTWAANR